jgi:hypothetical protein
VSRKKKTNKRPARPSAPAESRSADAATVFWVTSLLATVLAEAAGLAARLVIVLIEPFEPIALLSNLLLLIAAVTGAICLGMTPVVLRVREVPPPPAITRFAVAASILPIATLALIAALSH